MSERNGSPSYCFDWASGAGAQVEIFSPGPEAGKRYQLKYTPPFRAILRPPVQDQDLGAKELGPIDAQLKRLAQSLTAPQGDPGEQMESLGSLLYDLLIPPGVGASLRSPNLFLDVGMDERLLDYPWELMHDGQEYLCLKHFMGRFVNGTKATPPDVHATEWWVAPLKPLVVLLISVPKPKWGDGRFGELSWVSKETEAITNLLSDNPAVNLVYRADKNANYTSVYEALKTKRPHVIHFCGHARFDPDDPDNSCLVLHDQALSTGTIATLLKKFRPIFCFINACDSTRIAVGRGEFNFGLSRAFLESGAYLLGSRWPVNDDVAAAFAPRFYKALLDEQKPLGQAIREAREAARGAVPGNTSWASYVYYGDPRVYFRKVEASETPS